MEIFRENFIELLPFIMEHMEASDFISFDLEMTGINSNQDRNRKDDTASLRYQKMANIATKYNIIQVGLCIFKKLDDNKYSSL